jgi:hypothetical protein
MNRAGIMSRLAAVLFVLIIFGINDVSARQYFRTDGKQVVDAAGNPAMKYGIGLGGWLMPEGYMVHFPGYGSVTNMRNKIRELIGETDAAEFWDIYRANYVDEKDIAALITSACRSTTT